MAILLDTNHCVYLNNAKNKRLEERKVFEQNTLTIFDSASDPLFISEVTLGEMYFGASKSQQKAKNYARIEALRVSINILPVTLDLWKLFGDTKADLGKQGKVIADFDLLIGCTAIYHNLILVTNDKAFDMLKPTLQIVNWSAGITSPS